MDIKTYSVRFNFNEKAGWPEKESTRFCLEFLFKKQDYVLESHGEKSEELTIEIPFSEDQKNIISGVVSAARKYLESYEYIETISFVEE